MTIASKQDLHWMREALRLARRGFGTTSPNPMVGAVLVKHGKVIGRGWHRRAGEPHGEIEALRDAAHRGNNPSNATLFVTLEPCSTHGRTPPCTDAIVDAGIKRVVVGTTDPNPKHSGKGLTLLRRAGVTVHTLANGRATNAAEFQKLSAQCADLNEAFNHWIVHRTPLVTVKAAMTLDGKIATAKGESKWITGEQARAEGMNLRRGSDAIVVGVNTILLDNPSLTVRPTTGSNLRRIVLDSMARTPLKAKVVGDAFAELTTIVVSRRAPQSRVKALAKRVRVLVAPVRGKSQNSNSTSQVDLRWLLKKLGSENVTSLLVEGGGEVNASFLLGGLAQRIAFFYAPTILGGRDSRRGVAGDGAGNWREILELSDVQWRHVGRDLMLTARVSK